MFSQGPKPLGALRTAWRHRARLRRSVLQSMDIAEQDRDRLFQLYDDFGDPDARKSYRDGTFDESKGYPRTTTMDSDRAHILEVAERWNRAYLRTEVGNLLLLVTLALGLLTVAGLAGR